MHITSINVMKDLIRTLGDTDSYLRELAMHELTILANENQMFKALLAKELTILIAQSEGLQVVLGIEDELQKVLH